MKTLIDQAFNNLLPIVAAIFFVSSTNAAVSTSTNLKTYEVPLGYAWIYSGSSKNSSSNTGIILILTIAALLAGYTGYLQLEFALFNKVSSNNDSEPYGKIIIHLTNSNAIRKFFTSNWYRWMRVNKFTSTICTEYEPYIQHLNQPDIINRIEMDAGFSRTFQERQDLPLNPGKIYIVMMEDPSKQLTPVVLLNVIVQPDDSSNERGIMDYPSTREAFFQLAMTELSTNCQLPCIHYDSGSPTDFRVGAITFRRLISKFQNYEVLWCATKGLQTSNDNPQFYEDQLRNNFQQKLVVIPENQTINIGHTTQVTC